MKLWEIVKLADEGALKPGDKFKGLGIPIDLIIEFDGSELVYASIMGDKTTRNSVSLCSGELKLEYEKYYEITNAEKLKQLCDDPEALAKFFLDRNFDCWVCGAKSDKCNNDCFDNVVAFLKQTYKGQFEEGTNK